MSISFTRFKYLWDTDALDTDTTWRGYEILKAVREKHVQCALKELGLTFTGEHWLSYVCALYEIPRSDVRAMLGGWWLWRELSRGKRVRVPLKLTGYHPPTDEGVPPAQAP